MTTHFRKATLGFLTLAAFAIAASVSAAPVIVSPGKAEGAPGKEVEVAITLKSVKDVKAVTAMSIRLQYDPEVLTFKSIDKGPALPNALYDKSIDEKANPGMLGIGFACGSKSPDSKDMAEIDADGVVLKVIFTINEKAAVGKKTVIKLDNYRVMDNQDPPNEVSVKTEEGEVTVVSSPGSIAGGIDRLWIYIGIGIAVFFMLLILILAGRRREAPQQAAPGHAAGTAPPRFTPASATFTHKCVKCGGAISLPVAMVGQSFQCGACGATQTASPS